eukprot:scaffold285_cov58-Attheya_sp.AAC.3
MTSERMSEVLRGYLRNIAPSQMDDLWDFESSFHTGGGAASMCHMLADFVGEWTSQEDISLFLASEPRCQALVKQLSFNTMWLGMGVQQVTGSAQFHGKFMFIAPCVGCNTPYDAGGCEHANTPDRMELNNDQIRTFLHRSILTLQVVCELLARELEQADTLVRLLVVDVPAETTPMDWTTAQCQSGNIELLSTNNLVGVLDNCSDCLPKASMLAAAALSLIVSRRPAVALSLLDPEPLAGALHKYFVSIFRLLSNSECKVEERFGLAAYINILPLLYFLSYWPKAHRVLPKHDLDSILSSLLLNILHSAYQRDTGEEVDGPIDLDAFPELQSAKIYVEALFGENNFRRDMLQNRPMTFAIAATVEILGCWQHKKVPVTSSTINTTDNGHEPIPDCIAEYSSKFDEMVTRVPETKFARDIAEKLWSRQDPKRPSKDSSLLRFPLLRSSMQCSLSSCSRDMNVSGGDLYACSGGCDGLARYCCPQHQREHWAQHKRFCKLNRR